MRASRLLKPTLKETPADAEVISHQLMLRAGMVRKLASGLYTWLPLGLRVLRKVENIVRDEMDKASAQELLMPVVQPAELWHESKRWEQYGPELLRITDRHDRAFCLGPTHEEVITDLARNELNSYKQLPVNFYQIQTKFRDEIRPRFGIMRSREFIMKDAYSFHLDQASLQQTYERMHQAYCNIFERIGLNYRAVLADTGSIGGSNSHEFHVLAKSGEDAIAFSNNSDYAANIEKAEALPPSDGRMPPNETLEKVATPNSHTIDEVASLLAVRPDQIVKTLIVKADTDIVKAGTPPLIALILRGDHQLNELKAEKIQGVAAPLTLADDDEIESALGCKVGSIGPVNLAIPTIIDRTAANMSDFVCGANTDGFHYTGVNWERDCQCQQIEDLRNVVAGDPSPDGKGLLEIKRGIEVGHIFQLGKKYSDALNASVLSESGKAEIMTMGCYGIGITRVVAATIEQHHDDNGIIWPITIAPFHIAVVPINPHKSEQVRQVADSVYSMLQQQGYDVLLMDEDKARLGVMLSDVELIGIPHRIVIGDRGIENNVVEYKGRRDTASQDISLSDLSHFLTEKIEL